MARANRTTRAYSILTVKAVDATRRRFSGIATTPTPDRLGDVVEPLGVSFSNPLPLLLYHDSRLPVGTVTLKKPTAAGIEFEAEIPVIDEPGTLRDRVEEAWQSIGAKILRGVSIGFRIIEEAFVRETSSFRYLETEVLELSLVAIPANPDATIDQVRSFCQAASGRNRPGVSGTDKPSGRKDAHPMKNITERMAAMKATKDAKVVRMNELAGSDDDRTMSAEEQTEFDGLREEVKQIDADLVRLDDLEKINRSSAAPVAGANADDAAASRAGRTSVISVKDNTPAGVRFARYAMCLAAAKGDVMRAVEISKARYPHERNIHEVLKAAVAAGTTTDPNWAGPLVQYQDFAGDFIEYLRPQTIIGKFGTNGIPGLRRVPFNIRVGGQTSGGNGYWVGQGQPKPVTRFDFTNVTLRWAKVANIAVITEELARFSSPSAEMLVRDALSGALIERMDTDFVDPQKAEVPDVSPASITNGITGIDSTGNDAAAVRQDVKNIMAPFIAAKITPAQGVWIMSATTALALSLMRNDLGQKEFPDLTMTGGRFEGLPVIVSEYVASLDSPHGGNLVILVNASDIYLSDDGQVVIDVSREASLQMDDAPTNASTDNASPPAPVPTQVVSLWQTNSIGLRAERFVNWKRRRDAAVQYLYDVNWGG